MNFESYLQGVIWGITIVGVILVPYLVFFAIYLLAKSDMFFTIVQEGTAKAVLLNGRFHEMLMSFRGHDFKGDATKDEVERWEIIQKKTKTGWIWSTLRVASFGLVGGGMYWIGVYPFAQIHTFKLKWSSLEQKKEGDKPVVTFNTKEVPIRAILVRSDVYALFLENVEVKGGVPVSMIFAITIKVVNPYKALFKIEKWLEATLNQLGSELRKMLGGVSYEELVNMVKSHPDLGNESVISDVIREILPRFGVGVEKVQLLDLAPDTKFVEATTQKYVAEQKAKAIEALASGEANRVKTVYGAIKEIEDGLTIRGFEALAGANLFIGGENLGGLVRNIQVGNVPPVSKQQGGVS